MKVAIASSGLGHVARGIETWALDTAVALAEQGIDVTLFCGGSLQPAPSGVACVVLPCRRRYDRAAPMLAAVAPRWSWRWAFKSAYGWEQCTFWRRLRRELLRGGYDVLHVQDPMLAYWCRRARERGQLNTVEILAHGTEESMDFLLPFDCVQHLAPWHLSEAQRELEQRGQTRPRWTAIPNFVDTACFRPCRDQAEKQHCRARLGLPEDAFILGCVAAVKKPHKRIDYLIDEFAAFARSREDSGGRPVHLVIAGSRQKDSEALMARAREKSPDAVSIHLDLGRDRMPDFYRALDLFVLASLLEMMPIALLEAISSGVPAVTNAHPVMAWMTGAGDASADGAGEGGDVIDMAGAGALAEFLSRVEPGWLDAAGRGARERAEALFAKEPVIQQYISYYEQVVANR